MKKHIAITALFFAVTLFLSACASPVPKISDKSDDIRAENSSTPPETGETANCFPDSLVTIPDSYLSEAEQQGTLHDLYYDTYESFSYDEKSQKLQKHAVVYLPYGYD